MVPIFVAVLVWLIRILIIGTFSLSGDRLFSQSDEALRHAEPSEPRPAYRPVVRPTPAPTATRPVERPAPTPRPAQVIGEDEENFGFDQRPRPIADNRSGDTRRPPPAPPAPAPRPSVPLPAVRPAPKPSGSFSPPANGNANGPRTLGMRGSETSGSSHSEH
jgi:hypothetical protein